MSYFQFDMKHKRCIPSSGPSIPDTGQGHILKLNEIYVLLCVNHYVPNMIWMSAPLNTRTQRCDEMIRSMIRYVEITFTLCVCHSMRRRKCTVLIVTVCTYCMPYLACWPEENQHSMSITHLQFKELIIIGRWKTGGKLTASRPLIVRLIWETISNVVNKSST
jgi:hypothetical protein